MWMVIAVQALVYVSLFLLYLCFFDDFKIIKEEAKVLILGKDVQQHLGVFVHEAGGNAWECFIMQMKIIVFHLGGPWIANRVWRDYTQMDAIVYIVSARNMEQFLQQREELRTLVFQMEAFANVPFLILCIRNPGIGLSEEAGMNWMEPYANFQFLLSHRANPGNFSEERLVNHLGLNNVRTGRGNVQLANANVRPLEVFVVDEFNREHYLEGIRWLYDHLTNH